MQMGEEGIGLQGTGEGNGGFVGELIHCAAMAKECQKPGEGASVQGKKMLGKILLVKFRLIQLGV